MEDRMFSPSSFNFSWSLRSWHMFQTANNQRSYHSWWMVKSNNSI